MLDNKGFDLWADGYDKSVQLSEENNEYPFAGYKDVLGTVYNMVHRKEKAKLLDIGFGTGVLTKKLYDDGYEIYGIDFSEKMIEIAKEKMPLAKLMKYDFVKGLPEELEGMQFDYIISSYAIHHLEDKDKINFIKILDKYLADGGEIIIGDIAFETRELLEQCKMKFLDYWDDSEMYIVFDELKDVFLKRILASLLYPLVPVLFRLDTDKGGILIKIRLKYFGLGTIHLPEYIELPEGTNIEELFQLIQGNTEIPSQYLLTSTFLINNSKANKDEVLNDGDEVLILRSLGGG